MFHPALRLRKTSRRVATVLAVVPQATEKVSLLAVLTLWENFMG